jgi:hypothetical protein
MERLYWRLAIIGSYPNSKSYTYYNILWSQDVLVVDDGREWLSFIGADGLFSLIEFYEEEL